MFTPTEEQVTIIDFCRKEKANLLVNALAGAAKTSTLVLAAQALPLVPTLSVAFNKKIADEMAKRLPTHVTSKTLNSVGHQVWGRKTGRRLAVEPDKLFTLIKEENDGLRGEDKKQLSDAFASTLRAARKAKSLGYVPDKFRELAAPLATQDEWLDAIGDDVDVELDDFLVGVIDRVLNKSIALAYEGKIDFDDQIYMSTLFGGEFPRFPITMVDEAQDLSPMNHLMLEKMFGERLIAVGDPNQAIYGFRGAHADSMAWLRQRFNMHELTLSVSFRCPRKVVERAQLRVPHMRYPDWAVDGKVEHLHEWSSDHIPDGAAIICRNNAPLFSAALRLIRQGRSVKLLGADVGPALVKLMKKFGPNELPREEVDKAINAWEEAELKKARESRRAGIIDRAECLRVFADYGKTLGEAIAWAEQLFKQGGNVQLMTGHKSKGLEFDVVFHLDPWRIPSKYAREAASFGDNAQLNQEYNLRYVIETRAKQEMYLVNLEEFE